MAFYPMEKLKNGEYQFIFQITESDYKRVINDLRRHYDKDNIINGFIKSKDEIPYFCFEVIYDMEEYADIVLELLENKKIYKSLITSNCKIGNILYKTTWGKDFVCENLEQIMNSDFALSDTLMSTIFSYIFSNIEKCEQLIKKLYLHPNLHFRYTFMRYLIFNYPEKVNLIYDDITKYLTSYTYQENEQMTFVPELMNEKEIAHLANLIYEKLDKSVWNKIKEHILNNYNQNYLASYLLGDNDTEKINDFKQDSDMLFKTSSEYKLKIYQKYRQFISEELISDFEYYLSYFDIDDSRLKHIMDYGLWDEMVKYIDKYLNMSSDSECRLLGNGSTTSCYKIGDFVFKLVKGKYSCEDVICPRSYLVLPNLEEHYIRNSEGRVLAGIEVQKYLSRGNDGITNIDIDNFKSQFKAAGYMLNDTVVGGDYGDNCLLLDSYKDADCYNPENLPEEFKKRPLVLVDHDLVYKVDDKVLRRFRCGYKN